MLGPCHAPVPMLLPPTRACAATRSHARMTCGKIWCQHAHVPVQLQSSRYPHFLFFSFLFSFLSPHSPLPPSLHSDQQCVWGFPPLPLPPSFLILFLYYRSKEAKNFERAQKKAAAPPSALQGLLGAMGKKSKMSTVKKTAMDWDTFKEKEGITDELAQ